MIELGRPSMMGIIKFDTGEGSNTVEKNLKDDVIGINGVAVDLRLPQGAVGFLVQFRTSSTGKFRYSFKANEVTKTTDGIFWTSKPDVPDGETGISVDSNRASDKLNVYFASSVADQTLEIRIWHGHG